MKVFRAFALLAAVATAEDALKKHHKKHHHKKHHHKHSKEDPEPKKAEAKAEEKKAEPAKAEEPKKAESPVDGKAAEEGLVKKIKQINDELAKKETNEAPVIADTGRIDVNGPLPADFSELFAQAVSKSTGCKPTDIKVAETNVVSKADANIIVEIVFQGPAKIVHGVKLQSADPNSPLANGVMQPFLVAKDPIEAVSQPPSNTGIDVDTEMPYGELEPFGREDTAHELTESSIKESDAMVDQMERAEVAEEKRSVFRALTRLRGAAITSFDGVARSQTGNIDEYNKVHKWRKTHPLHHLAAEESDVSRWAFPDASD